MTRHRTLRYGAPILTVIVGVLFAAAVTNSVGNTVATLLIAAGLIWLMVNLGRDMGMAERTGRRPPVPAPLPPDEDSGGAPSAHPPVSPSK